jgi:membrane protein
MKQAAVNLFWIIVRSIRGFKQNDGIGVSAEAAYRFVIALPALVIVFTSLSSAIATYTGVDAFEMLLDRARFTLPFEVYSTLELVLSSIREQSGIGILALGFGIATWSGSNAINALLKGINRAHAVEDARGFVRQRLVAFALLVGIGAVMIISFLLLTFGSEIRDEVGRSFGLGAEFEMIWNIARWPFLLLIVIGALSTLYWAGPARHVEPKAIFPGALCATILWIIATYGFSIYLTIVDPGSAYGIIGSLIALMLFLYISSIVVIFGAEVNATIRRQKEFSKAPAEEEDHPVGVMSSLPEGSPTRFTIHTTALLLVLVTSVGAFIAGIFKRTSSDGSPPGQDR